MKIYDLFTFNNELDLLEIRLNELDSVVDTFIICESTMSHNNEPKPLYFSNNRKRFKKFLHKIDLVIFDSVKHTDSWSIENDHRRALSEKIPVNLNEEDILLLSDLDEIPRKDIVEKLKSRREDQFPATLCSTMYSGSFYNHVIAPPNQLHNDGTVALKFIQYKQNQDLQHYRNIRSQTLPRIYDAGWHFTSMGGPKNVLKKIQSFAHNEYRDSGVAYTERGISDAIKEGTDVFGRIGYVVEKVELDDTFPKYLLENKDKFKNLIEGNDVPVSFESDHPYYLLQHMLYSMKNADFGSSKLDEGYINFKINGLTSSKVRHLLNNLVSLYQSKYLEIGTYEGATFSSALYKNKPLKAVAIDDFSLPEHSEDFEKKNKIEENFYKNMKSVKTPFEFVNKPSFTEGILDDKNYKFNIYFYDGCHAMESQKKALLHYKKYLDEYFILIVDDFNNFHEVQTGTYAGLKEGNFEIIYEKYLPARYCGDMENYWHGLFVGLIKNN